MTKWNLCFVIQMVGVVREVAVLKSNAFQSKVAYAGMSMLADFFDVRKDQAFCRLSYC